MASAQVVLDTQKNIEESLFSRMAEFEKQLKSTVSTDSKLNLDQLALDYKTFKETVLSIFQMLRNLIQNLTLQIDDLDSYNRRNALLVSGIEESDNEDCKALIIHIIQSTMNLENIQVSAIHLCHRLGTRNSLHSRPILVRFADSNTRNLIWNEKKRLKSSSTVLSEFLTRPRQAIFTSARKHFGITRCWTRDGKVFVKLPSNDRKRITSIDELNQLMAEFPASTTALTAKKTTTEQQRSRAGPPPVVAAPTTRRNVAAKIKVNK